MDAHVGDRLVIQSRRVGQPAREGEIIHVMYRGGGVRCRVRWDDGHESVVVPGTDAVVRESPGTHDIGREIRTVTIDLHLEEDSECCEAVVTIPTSIGTFSGSGRARRHPKDPLVPMIGEELAVARSFVDLGAKLEDAANNAIANHETRPLHLIP